MEQGDYFFIAGGRANLYSPYGNQYGYVGSYENGNYLSKDPAIILSCIYPKDTLPYDKDPCSSIFISVLFIIVQKLKTT